MIIYRFLAKSEAIDKIYSLLKQNVKSRNARQKSNFARLAHFFWYFAVVLHDYNEKLPVTWDQAQFERSSYILSNGYRWK